MTWVLAGLIVLVTAFYQWTYRRLRHHYQEALLATEMSHEIQMKMKDFSIRLLERQNQDMQVSLETALRTTDEELAQAHLSLGMALQEILRLESPEPDAPEDTSEADNENKEQNA